MREALSWTAVLLAALTAQPAMAQDDIPETSGFGGFVLVGAGYFNVESNLIVTGAPLVSDVGNAQIASIFDAPTSGSSGAVPFSAELNYTFAGTRTQLFFGNRLEDMLRLDVVFGIGVRQELPDKSILAASLLVTPAELKFWSDPYVEGEDRTPTALNWPGLRLRWARILKTGLEVTATARRYRHDEENSGDWLISQGRLTPQDQPLLNRDGDILELQALYRIDVKRHRFEPTVRYIDDNHDGAAMANSGYSLQLTYLYLSPKVVLDANVLYGNRKGDAVHPVYGEALDADRWGAALTALIPVTLFNSRAWSVFVSGEVLRVKANIDFFDTRLAELMAGLIWRAPRR